MDDHEHYRGRDGCLKCAHLGKIWADTPCNCEFCQMPERILDTIEKILPHAAIVKHGGTDEEVATATRESSRILEALEFDDLMLFLTRSTRLNAGDIACNKLDAYNAAKSSWVGEQMVMM